ncbi:MAG: GNAT family N-acetyltransferase, partial [Clostridia bacterium]|nr:GNAT family N-acetyltransferase [Clostridia bacterium]
MAHKDKESKIKSVFCFVVSPEYRCQGISGALLDRVCEEAEKEGFDFLEAYPCKEFV